MSTGTVTNVSDHVEGSELSAAVIATATTLPVVNVNQFDHDGGYLNIGGTLSNRVLTGGEQFAYTYVLPVDGDGVDIAPEDGSGNLTLVGSLANPYAAGERVYLVDANGKLFVERFAYYLEPDGEEELKATVPVELVPFLPEGPRTEDAAEQIEAYDRGADHVLLSILGRSAVADLNSVLLTTSPDGTGERVDIGPDGIREYEADGTTVAISLTQGQGLDLRADLGLDTTTSRRIRWLVAAGTEIGSVQAFETSVSDFAYLKSVAEGDRLSQVVLSTQGSSPGTSGAFNVWSKSSSDTAEVYLTLQSSGAGVVTKSLFKLVGSTVTSDFELDVSHGWQNWTPTLTGWSANPAGAFYRYKQMGKVVVIAITQPTNGTSNATSKSISLPVTARTAVNMTWTGQASIADNGTFQTTFGRGVIDAALGGTVANFYTNAAAGGWTASGGARVATCTLVYEAA